MIGRFAHHRNRVKSVYVKRVVELIEEAKEIEMKSELKYPMVIYPAEEGGYVAEVPALKGCLAQGETLVECLEELKEVQTLWLESAKRNKERVPSAAQVAARLRKVVA